MPGKHKGGRSVLCEARAELGVAESVKGARSSGQQTRKRRLS